MNNKIITINNTEYVRLNKTLAKRAFDLGMNILVYGDNANPYSEWVQPCVFTKDDDSFDEHLNAFTYYNYDFILRICKYYISEEDNARLMKLRIDSLRKYQKRSYELKIK